MAYNKKHWIRFSGIAVLNLAIIGASFSATPITAQTPALADPRYDLTKNRVVNHADITEVMEVWTTVQEGTACSSATSAPKDVNGNGCIDIADVQAVAAQWGRTTDSQMKLPDPNAITAANEDATFTVTSNAFTGDENLDDGICRSTNGQCTLKAALEQSNNRNGRERIVFDVRNTDGSCPDLVTIEAPANATEGLEIEDLYMDGVIIDGYTQCGASPNTLPVGSNAIIKIELKGNLTQNVNGLEIDSPHNVVRGLAIYNWDFQLRLDYAGASNNRIEGNFLGTNAANTFTLARGSVTPFGEQHHEGLRIQGLQPDSDALGGGAANNIIGGTTPDTRNIISGNRKDGIKIQGNANNNRIIGNIIGLKKDGKTRWANYTDGVDFEYGARYNSLGGTKPGEGNVISGNFSDGIEVSHTPRTQFNTIAGNYFGLTADGTATVRNDGSGFTFEDRVDSNYAYNNIVGGNKLSGVFFFVLGTNNQVYNNRIGVGPNGEAMGNGVGTPNPSDPKDPVSYYGRNGIQLMGGAQRNKIYNNIIANHPEDAIAMKNTSDEDNGYFGETYFNTVSRNSMYNNGNETTNTVDGIDLRINYERGVTYPNQGLLEPVISSATTGEISGRAALRSNAPCVDCTIEVFIADPASVSTGSTYAEGKTFVTAGKTGTNGNFTIPVCNNEFAAGQVLSATSTDPQGNTSQFSPIVTVTAGTKPDACASPSPSPSPSPTPFPTGVPRIWLPQVRK